MNSLLKKVFVLLSVCLAFVIAWRFGFFEMLSLESIKERHLQFLRIYDERPYQVMALFFIIYVVATALSFPGAAFLTLLGGALFGLVRGSILVSFASTIGATLAFLISRILLRDWVEARFGKYLKGVNEGIKKEGSFYLFSLRMIPVIPFFVINLVMGLTAMKVGTYFIISQLGMLLGTVAYVNAGTQLQTIKNLNGILSPKFVVSLLLLALLPILLRSLVSYLRFRALYKPYTKPRKFDYNLIVIGAGSGGLVTSYIASAIKAKVALIEKHKMGGDCLNTGCVPSKALIQSAKMLSHMKRATEFGLRAVQVDFDFADVMERVQKVIKKVEPHDSVERYSQLGVECLKGTAHIKSPFEVQLDGKILTTKSIVIASGARPLIPKIPGLDQMNALTSDTVWNLRALPKRLLVLGGGPIGCELTQCFARFGSQVILVEMADRILVREDEDVSDFIHKKFLAEGVRIFLKHKAIRFEEHGTHKIVVCEHENQEVKIEFDQVLLALGRKANVQGFGLESLGIELTSRGTIQTDEYLRTKFPNILACGDVVGPFQFTHTAAHQAWYAAVNALVSPFKKFAVDYNVIPWCTFTDPEVARVGLNELECKEQGIAYEISVYPIDDLDRAITDSEDHGFVKVLTVPAKDKILGATIVGAHAGDIICEYVAAMKNGLGMETILGTIHVYPTFAESNKFVAGVWKKAHTPVDLLKWVEKFHRWRRN